MMLLGSMFAMALALALSALASRARPDCDACVAGQCHSRRPILAGFPVTGQMTIDRSLNVLYLQLNSNQNVAIFLDDLQHRLINMMSTRGMDVDQSSHTLYMGTEDGPFYRYDLDSNTTVGVPQLNKGLRPNIIKYLRHNTLVYIEDYANNTSVFHFVSTSVFDVDYTLSVNYPVKDFVLDDRNIYFVSNNTLYVCDQIYTGSYPPQPPKEIITKKHMSISSSYFENNYKNDWIYIGSASEKLIYKLNKSTQELIIHAGYKSGAVQDFVTGKDDVIVFREMDGSVVQWVPSDHRCVVEPPHGDFFVRETTCL